MKKLKIKGKGTLSKRTQDACPQSLTAHKVSEVVFHAKPRTKSFRRAGSALATLLISSAIEGYWNPLHARTCKQAHTFNVNPHSTPQG